MNSYKITYTTYPEHGKYHFSYCRATIKGESFEEAVSKFRDDQMTHGNIICGVVEGDLLEVTFYELKK